MDGHDTPNTAAPAWARGLDDDLDGFVALAEWGLLCRNHAGRRTAVQMIRWIAGAGEAETLEQVLNLDGAGWTGARMRLRMAQRDAAIRRIAAICWPELSVSAKAQDLAVKWRRWAADVANRPAPPFEKEPAATFRKLSEAGHKPLGKRQLQEILSRELAKSTPVETASDASHVDDKKDETP
ncbi:hypothetical protein A3731_24640 [Roseovarius sp. HI0049]|nr:hypothetical protein A3731_25290 [Roseovarius sp. HI0049]KZY30746.1 hypothetical protein A3731_24640 [Roseovarius sp. HI0049]